MNILVTGASGQLGSTLKSIANTVPGLHFAFASSKQLDITDFEAVRNEMDKNNYAYCINCAAFTHVDNAESETDKAKLINVTGARNLALNCHEHKTVLIHISTDFVFDGYMNEPYREEDIARPIGFYGDTKYKGERAIINNLQEHFIIRTSWLYSEFGNNFMKTMLRLGAERDELSVVYDQVGTPTYARDLAKAILHIIKAHSIDYGVYHYSNEGVASWYDFAKAIFDEQGIQVTLNPIRSEAYPTPAARPKFSVLDKEKMKSTFKIDIPNWRDSLAVAIKAYAKLPA
ncbi:dTDP-4-dehydrorhamnose reductase [Croceitalea dokdonensis DOKDO 023]|uniref:dTDP-4-dehydrorhamnose reductase n=1 Tax=Croceitalea dokdonensis DOKDO 023 TaxID=1300341 RepID=A0A0P7ADB8_9FLAO|nr:dTDP-4-dehydrorhamnose reductase [Croceitalea dokdonensis]KPM31209.1 dTDP-4-dehydrorhamnose reductase [Croceitalea dokdonensis DOKDO 023]